MSWSWSCLLSFLPLSITDGHKVLESAASDEQIDATACGSQRLDSGLVGRSRDPWQPHLAGIPWPRHEIFATIRYGCRQPTRPCPFSATPVCCRHWASSHVRLLSRCSGHDRPGSFVNGTSIISHSMIECLDFLTNQIVTFQMLLFFTFVLLKKLHYYKVLFYNIVFIMVPKAHICM